MKSSAFQTRAMKITLILGFATSCAHIGPQMVPLNSILPNPAPSAALSHWTSTATRTSVSQTVAGAVLRGWRFSALPGSRQHLSMLFFNGNGMTVDDSQALYRQLSVQGADLTVFDYRGYGFSTGKPDVLAFRGDALTLYDKLAENGPVIVYGFSMGTAIAGWVASQRHVAGLILAGTIATAAEEFPVFARAQGLGVKEIASMVPAPEAVDALNGVGHIRQSEAPLLMLHGEDDRLVPIEQGREVFRASPSSQKQFVSLPGMGHNDTTEAPEALQAVRAFLSSLSASAPASASPVRKR